MLDRLAQATSVKEFGDCGLGGKFFKYCSLLFQRAYEYFQKERNHIQAFCK